MKMKTFLMVALLTVSGVSLGLASDKSASTTDNKATATKQAKEKKTILTGSYIPREVHHHGQITDGPSPVWVVDQKTIRNSGASDLRQLLVRQGVNH